MVVLLHGFLENKEMWQEIASTLAKKNRVISIDLLGHGKSENLSYIHTMEQQAKMVKALLNHLKLRKYHIIGHSLGGYIALAFTELFSENIKSLVLMNSTAKADSLEKQTNRNHAIYIVKKNPNAFVKMAIPNLFSEKSRVEFKLEIEKIKSDALKTSQQGILASLEGMKIRKDRTAILRNASFKILLIIGLRDPILQYSDLIEQTQNTKVKIAKLPNGHMSHIENKKEVIALLVDFLR